jgi:hypothetical protein
LFICGHAFHHNSEAGQLNIPGAPLTCFDGFVSAGASNLRVSFEHGPGSLDHPSDPNVTTFDLKVHL